MARTGLILAALFLVAPFTAAAYAERTNDWVDADRNGTLDPMANGSYDWVDVNGHDFVLAWGALAGTPAIVAVVVRRCRELSGRS